MKTYGDDEMNAVLATAKSYSLVVLRDGPNAAAEDARGLVWEHGRRNLGLRDAGTLAVVLPVPDESELCGVGVFVGSVEETIAVMNDDPGVQAGVFTFEVHPCIGFPGDALP